MKTRTTILALIFLLLGGPIANAQDLMDALRQAAAMHNESRGEENNNPESTNEEEGEQPTWSEIAAEIAEEYEVDLNGLDAYQQCFVLMTFCLFSFYDMEEKIEDAGNCETKYNFYGMQLLNIASMNTIMYCPEKISNLSDSTQKEAYDGYFGPLRARHRVDGAPYEGEDIWVPLKWLRDKKFGDPLHQDSRTNEFIEWMWQHFHPYFTLAKVAEIGKKMEALGCGG